MKQKHVKLKVGNMTAFTILNNMGTRQSWKLNELNKDIWEWCIVRDGSLFMGMTGSDKK